MRQWGTNRYGIDADWMERQKGERQGAPSPGGTEGGIPEADELAIEETSAQGDIRMGRSAKENARKHGIPIRTYRVLIDPGWQSDYERNPATMFGSDAAYAHNDEADRCYTERRKVSSRPKGGTARRWHEKRGN